MILHLSHYTEIDQPTHWSLYRILLQGAGLLGAFASAVLKTRGCEVYCADVNEKRLDMVARFGAIPLLGKPERM